MSHYLFRVTSNAQAPAAGNDMGSWFRYYKWEVDDEVFLPVHDPSRKNFLDAKPGDTLWIALDCVVLGSVPVIRVEDEAAQRKIEIWYDATAKSLVEPGSVRADLWMTGKLPEEVGEQWAGRAKRVP